MQRGLSCLHFCFASQCNLLMLLHVTSSRRKYRRQKSITDEGVHAGFSTVRFLFSSSRYIQDEMIDDIKKLVWIPGYANMQRHLRAKRGMKKRKKKMIRLMVYHTIAQTATSETRARYFLLKESRLFFFFEMKKHFYILEISIRDICRCQR